MSKNADTLYVYTVPSRKVGYSAREMSEPYRQIVGVQDSRDILWTAPDLARGIEEYSRRDTERYVLPVTREGAKRILGMWVMYYLIDPADRINCHKWAQTIQDGVGVTLPPRHIIADGVRVSRLALGAHGVVGTIENGSVYADHSISGLGLNNTDALQVMSADGPLGIADIGQVVDYYSRHDPGLPRDYGVYVLPPELRAQNAQDLDL